MRRFLFTSEKYTGTAELWYSTEGALTHLLLGDSNMTRKQRQVYKDRAPVDVENVEPFVRALNLVCVEADFTATFDMFWAGYNKKINKVRCLPLWNKLSKTDQVKAWAGIKNYDKFLKRDGRFKCDPENYLRNKMWENEY